MVTVCGFKECESKDGHKFFALTLQGGIEMTLSKGTGNYYATAKQAVITSTFDEKTCRGLIGSKLPGKIMKITCDPYEYTIKETGEIINLNHRWVYDPNEATSIEEVVFNQELTPAGLTF
jgi:hypothetical protein